MEAPALDAVGEGERRRLKILDEIEPLRAWVRTLRTSLVDQQAAQDLQQKLDDAAALAAIAETPTEILPVAAFGADVTAALLDTARQSLVQQQISIDGFLDMLVTWSRRRASGVPGGDPAAPRDVRDGVDWALLGEDLGMLWRSVPRIEFLNGPIEVQRKPQLRRRRTNEPEVEEATAPATVAAPGPPDPIVLEKARRSRLERAVRVVAPSRAEPKPLLPLVVHPQSFTETVENVFDLLSLVKSSKARVQKVDGQAPVIQTTDRDDSAAAARRARSCVLRLDYDEHALLVESLFESPSTAAPFVTREGLEAEMERVQAHIARKAARRASAGGEEGDAGPGDAGAAKRRRRDDRGSPSDAAANARGSADAAREDSESTVYSDEEQDREDEDVL